MKKRKIRILLAGILVVAMFAACAPAAAPAAPAAPAPAAPAAPGAAPAAPADAPEGNIYIGVMLPLTGGNAMTGWFVEQGVLMWLEDNPNGILGRPVEIIWADTQSSEAGANAAFLTIATHPGISATHGGQISNQGLAVVPLSQQHGIPTIHHGSSVQFAAAVREGNMFTWNNRINDGGTGFSMADALHNALGAQRIAIIHNNNAFGQGLADTAIAALRSFGVEPVEVLSYTTDERQFAPFISRVQASGADGLLVMSHPNEMALIQIEAMNAGLDVIKLGSPNAGAAATIALSEDAANGWYSISDWVPTIEDDPGRSLAARFYAEHDMHADMNVTSAYDIMTIFARAIEHNGCAEPASIQAALEYFRDNQTRIQGMATTISFNEYHIGNTSQFMAYNVDRVPQIIRRIYREGWQG